MAITKKQVRAGMSKEMAKEIALAGNRARKESGFATRTKKEK